MSQSTSKHPLNRVRSFWHNLLPAASCKLPESNEARQSKPPILRILHPHTLSLIIYRRCLTPRHPCGGGGIPTHEDRVTQLFRDRHKIERRPRSARHIEARERHALQRSGANLRARAVVPPEGRDSGGDDLRLGAVREYGEDGGPGRAEVDEAHVRLRGAAGAAADGEGYVLARYADDVPLVEVEELLQVVDEFGHVALPVLLGQLEVAEEAVGVGGEAGIFRADGSVEDGGIQVVERRIWQREELVWWDGRGGYVVRI
jgi:hypothetical protein